MKIYVDRTKFIMTRLSSSAVILILVVTLVTILPGIIASVN